MDSTKFRRVAEGVLSQKEMEQAEELFGEGRFIELNEYFLVAIDTSWFGGCLTFEEAERFYKLLDFPRELACRFRQHHPAIYPR